jgi:tRNA dimethylallyltransferase
LEPERGTLVVILGPTGVGKSRTAVHLATVFPGEVVNADSIQVYRGFDIGTDKPPAGVRGAVPHHLIDIVGPETQFTAADFVKGALEAAGGIHSRGRVPFIVGGTGLYLKALLNGLFPGPGRNPELRTALEAEAREKGLGELFERLKDVDPAYAEKIRGRDRVRIIRALEVFQSTGIPLSEHFSRTRSPVRGYGLVRIGLDLERTLLYRRIEDRVERMFDQGLVDEVRGLLERGISPEAPPFRALGYRHVLDVLAGRITVDEAKELTAVDTRHYAKRQMTWFRKMEGVSWFSPEDRKALEDHLRNQIK